MSARPTVPTPTPSELAEKQGAHFIDGAEDIDRVWLAGKKRIGVTAGASAPEDLVRGVIERLQAWSGATVQELAGDPENVTFALPKSCARLVG